MYNPLPGITLAVSIATSIAGCANDSQKNIPESQLSADDERSGLIAGSVTAPLSKHYHETMLFVYRSVDGNSQHDGVLTSGMQHGNPLIDIPTCREADIPQLCGRLFAVSLPAGDYEIYEAAALGREIFRGMPPMKFTVEKGRTLYLGNVHVSFCTGYADQFPW